MSELSAREIPVTWAAGGKLPNAIIVGRDGFYVRWQENARSLQLCVGHIDVVGGLWQEWADGGADLDDVARRPELIRNHARRMISAARRKHAELTHTNRQEVRDNERETQVKLAKLTEGGN
ncbi:hypothetical protein Porky_134 [Mycobacterium phage Porky]|uniref:Uncharacterized protein n=2 Tax=Kostyavirus porky TaxID=546185 RepID=B5A694_9CAUD|nr:hypothetical protein Porky_134 [Mycobacterium phage Porky]ACF33949.1 hypothetical protein Porky_134 [Mycobacterium phage Porky]AXQ60952.1 hypothetical protein SEA_EMMINA_133 [Mycobacterium phage Emmina]